MNERFAAALIYGGLPTRDFKSFFPYLGSRIIKSTQNWQSKELLRISWGMSEKGLD
jgi:hypothetical protein